MEICSISSSIVVVFFFYLVGETLEAALGQEGDADEEDAIVNQVLDEIGITMNANVCSSVFFFECSSLIFLFSLLVHHVYLLLLQLQQIDNIPVKKMLNWNEF